MKIAHWSSFEFRLLMWFFFSHAHRRIIKETQRNMPTSAPALWGSLSHCVRNFRKGGRDPLKKSVAIRTVPREESASRGQADLVDMQSMPMNKYKWIVVQCIRTISRSSVFCDKSKANVLQKLQHRSWTYFPFLVHRQYFRVATALSLQPTSSRKLKDFWPVSVIVHGKTRHLQSQGLVERSHGDIKFLA